MNKKRKTPIIRITLSIIVSIIAFIYVNQLYKYGQKTVQNWLQQQIIQEQRKLNLKLQWETLSVSLLPIKLEITNVVIHPTTVSAISDPFTVKKLKITPDYIRLLKGGLSAKITVIQPDIKIKIDQKPQQKKSQNNIQKGLLFLKNPEIQMVNIHFKQAKLLIQTPDKILSTKSVSGHIEPSLLGVNIHVHADTIQVNDRPLFYLSANINLKPHLISIKKITINNEHSTFNISGAVENFSQGIKNINKAWFNIQSSFTAEDFQTISKIIELQFQPNYQGHIKLNANLKYNKTTDWTGRFDFLTENLALGNFFLSRIKAQGIIQKKSILFNNLSINHNNKWRVSLNNATIDLTKPYLFKTRVSVKNSQLHSLFQSFNLKKVPVFSTVNGDWQCHGQLVNYFNLQCKGATDFTKLIVRNYSTFNIMQVPLVKTKNEFNVSSQGLKIKAQIYANEQRNKKDSYLEFSSHLNNKYQFSALVQGTLNFADIDDVMRLSPKGIAYINNGQIDIQRNKINIQSNIQAEQAMLYGFHMGKVSSQVNYTKKGLLRFRNIKGSIKKSRYNGQVTVNIFKKTIRVFSRSPVLYLENLQYALSNRLHLPFAVTGYGKGTVSVRGPFKINALSYNIQSTADNVSIKKELFEKGIVNIVSHKGYVKTNKAILYKNNKTINLTGKINPKGYLQAQITGSELPIQDFKNVTKIIGKNFLGIAQFNLDMKGFFLRPTTTANISIKDSYLKGHIVDNTYLSLKLKRHKVEVKGSLFNKIKIKKFIFPYKKYYPVAINLSTKDLDIKNFFFKKDNINHLQNKFHSKISGDINITYNKNQFHKSCNGSINVDDATFYSHSYKLTSKKPFSINVKNGHIHTNPILLQSKNQSLKINHDQQSNIKIKGNLKLDFLIFIFPFMRNLSGDLSTYVTMKPFLPNLQSKGWMQIKQATVQLHPAIEPFESIESKIQIKNQKWYVQSLYTKTGGGEIKGKGSLFFKHKDYIPVNIKGIFKKINFYSIPDIYATGSGSIQITGTGFPYTLGIKADLTQTRIEKEFKSKKKDLISVNPFLPKESVKEIFEPITLDLDLRFKNPIQIKNSTITADLQGNMKITGFPKSPLLSGDLHILPEGVTVFRDHKFNIVSAKIKYQNNKPANPFIDAIANTSIQEQIATEDFANKYDILLKIKGQGKKAKFSLTSTPTLSKNEIMSLLAFGVRSVAFKAGDNSHNIATHNIMKYSYYHLGPAFFQKAIGKELHDTLGLDDFVMLPYMNSKKNSTSTKLILRKKIMDKLNISTTRTILDDDPESKIAASYKINKNASVVVFWKNEQPIQESDLNSDAVGLDLEYQIDF